MRAPIGVTLAGIAVCICALFLAVTPLLYLKTSQAASSPEKITISVVLATEYLTILLFLIAIGLLRFRRWALETACVFTGMCAVYAVSRIVLVKGGACSVLVWAFLLASVLMTAYLIRRAREGLTTPSSGLGARPAGVAAMAVAGFASLPLSLIVLYLDTGMPVPWWEVTSLRFETLLCAALSFGLWRLKEWARILAEVVSFLAPVGVLPGLLRPTSHKAFAVTIEITALAYAAWSIWYLRKPEVIEAFEGTN